MKKTTFNRLSAITLLSLTILLHACKPVCERNPNDPECAGENELITTLRVTFTDSATGTAAGTFQFKDADGDGLPEQLDTLRLSANITYLAELKFLNESVSPAEDITPNIAAESNDHLIIFSTPANSLTFRITDYDNNTPPLPLGLQSYWRSASAGSSTVQITLRHQPGIKDGTPNPGDTDVEVTFPVQIQ
ncbi:MAG: hypothetical protein IPH78_12580 [Bacteroidetes bacterium]|nr:hypothetical protein [Bacteroidota bacterium]